MQREDDVSENRTCCAKGMEDAEGMARKWDGMDEKTLRMGRIDGGEKDVDGISPPPRSSRAYNVPRHQPS